MSLVAQIFNRLYRRFSIDRSFEFSRRSEGLGTSQNGILRYSRLKICATGALAALPLFSAIAARAVESWQDALDSMPLPGGVVELNMTNCVETMLGGLQSNAIVKGLVFMPGATDELYFFRRAKAILKERAPTMLDGVNSLKDQTRIQTTFRSPLLLLHTAEDSLEPLIKAEREEMIEKLKAARFVKHGIYNDCDWDAIQPILRKELKMEILPARYSSDSWHFYRHSFTGWNLNGWEALQAVLLSGKTSCHIEKQGGLSLRRTVIVFEQDRRTPAIGRR
jgi:hypothetical protein